MSLLNQIANILSLVGTSCGLVSRIPQVIKVYNSKSANDLSYKTMGLNVFANMCFLFYMIVHRQYFIMINCISVVTLEGSLIYMKHQFKNIKKTASQTDLMSMDQTD